MNNQLKNKELSVENGVVLFNGLAKRRSQLLLAMNVLAFVCALNGHRSINVWNKLGLSHTLEGESPLLASCQSQLASRKGYQCELGSEVSGTAKV